MIKNKKWLGLVLVFVLVAIMLAGCSGNKPAGNNQTASASSSRQASEQKVYKFRIQSANPASSLYFEILKKFGERLDKMSGGRLKAEILPDGAVVNAFELLDAVSKGIIEGGNAWTNYWSGKHPASTLFGAPPAGAGAGMDEITHLCWYYMGGGHELMREFYQNVLKADVEPFLLNPVGPDPLGWFSKPVNSIDDMKKMKFRTPPGIPGEIYTKLGIPAVSVAGGEIVPSAQKGVIDAAEWIGPADDMKLGLYQIWKYYYLQGLHQSTDVGDLFFNKKFWDSLPPDLQEIIKGAIQATMMETIYTNITENGKALEKYKKEYNVQVMETPKELIEQYTKKAAEVLDEYAAKDAFFKKVLDSQRAFASEIVPYKLETLKLYTSMGEAAQNK
ncbi:Monocarboxylate 2-oxoacid-binding periplasmic protein [Moorella humiferrea]|uniref:TRAP transporter substrate-binding protein n=1 Tax=Neomoorella humiferrea TaxID=676965 RepID=UPI0030CFE79D